MIAAESIIDSCRDDAESTQGKRRSFPPEAIAKGPAAAAAAKRAKGVAAYGKIAVTMKSLREAGLTYRAIAEALNADGHTTRHGSRWDGSNVLRVIRKYA